MQFWVRKVQAPRKNAFPQTKKKDLQDFQNHRYIGIFMSLREEERRGRDKESERWGERENESESKKGKAKASESKSAGDLISKPPGPK